MQHVSVFGQIVVLGDGHANAGSSKAHPSNHTTARQAQASSQQNLSW